MPRQPLERYDELMTPAQVAGAFHVKPPTVTRWANEGKLTAIWTPGGQRRYRRAEVDAILNPEPAQ